MGVKVNHKRGKPKRGTLTRITEAVRKEAKRRAEDKFGQGCPLCERCGAPYDLTAAHLINASQMGAGNVPWNVAMLCGTHGTKGCHDWADNTREGREWRQAYREELLAYYMSERGRQYWKITV